MSSQSRATGQVRAQLGLASARACRWRCRRPRCTWRRMRGMEVVVLRPEGFALPRRDHGQGAARGRRVRRLGARDQPIGARRWPARTWCTPRNGRYTAAYGDEAAGCQARRGAQGLVPDEQWFARARAGCRLMHCLPVRRNVALADSLLDGAAQRGPAPGLQSPAGADGRAVSTCSSLGVTATHMILHRSDHAATIRALRNASPYIRLYKGKIFVVKAGGARVRRSRADARADRADRDPALPRHPRRHGPRRRLAAHRADRGARRADAHGAGPAHHRREVDRCHLDGAQWPDQHPHPRDLPRAGNRRGRSLRRRCRAGPRAPAPAGAAQRRARGRSTSASSATSTASTSASSASSSTTA